jgi:hypothetical protein
MRRINNLELSQTKYLHRNLGFVFFILVQIDQVAIIFVAVLAVQLLLQRNCKRSELTCVSEAPSPRLGARAVHETETWGADATWALG